MRYEFEYKFSRQVLYSKLGSSGTIRDALQIVGRTNPPPNHLPATTCGGGIT